MRTRIATALIEIGAACFFALITLHFFLLYFGEAAPNAAQGWTFEINDHGAKVYVCWLAYYLQRALFFIALTTGLAGALVMPREPISNGNAFSPRSGSIMTVGFVSLALALVAFAIQFWFGPTPKLSPGWQQALTAAEIIGYLGIAGFVVAALAVYWRERRNDGKSD
jgi:hypothetical protein